MKLDQNDPTDIVPLKILFLQSCDLVPDYIINRTRVVYFLLARACIPVTISDTIVRARTNKWEEVMPRNFHDYCKIQDRVKGFLRRILHKEGKLARFDSERVLYKGVENGITLKLLMELHNTEHGCIIVKERFKQNTEAIVLVNDDNHYEGDAEEFEAKMGFSINKWPNKQKYDRAILFYDEDFNSIH
jgi:hypothetical protein